MTKKPSIVQVESTDGKFFSRLIDWLNNADVERDSTLIRVLDGEQPDPELTRLQAENARLREALTWAVGFIQCQTPNTSRDYPDMRNAEALVAQAPLHTGEFQLMAARAEVAEVDAKRLREACRAALEEMEGSLTAVDELEQEAHSEQLSHMVEHWRGQRLATADCIEILHRHLAAAERAEKASDHAE